MAWLSSRPDKKSSVREIAESLEASPNHLSKVMQRLVKAGLVSSTRGPKGGFVLNRDPESVTLLEVYEVIDGPLETTKCIFDHPVCKGAQCIFENHLDIFTRQLKDYLADRRLSDLNNFLS